MGSKIGRPIIGSLKNCDIKVRVDENTNQKLLDFAKSNNITRAEAIRKGIQLLLEKQGVATDQSYNTLQGQNPKGFVKSIIANLSAKRKENLI